MKLPKTQLAAVIIIILTILTLHLFNIIRQISSPLFSSLLFSSLLFSLFFSLLYSSHTYSFLLNCSKLYNAMLRCIIYNTTQYETAQCLAIQFCVIQHSTIISYYNIFDNDIIQYFLWYITYDILYYVMIVLFCIKQN